MRLILVRHGEVAANREMRYVGASDPALTPEGERQAAALAEAVAGLRPTRLLTSPRQRCRQTAEPIATAAGLEVAIEEALAEQDFGAWEGLTMAEVRAQGAEQAERLDRFHADSATPPPGGESQDALRGRAGELLARVFNESEDAGAEIVIMVSHVGPIKALLAESLGLSWKDVRRFFLDPGTVTVVDYRPSFLRVFNARPHAEMSEARWALRS